jgi:hypothetical protein
MPMPMPPSAPAPAPASPSSSLCSPDSAIEAATRAGAAVAAGAVGAATTLRAAQGLAVDRPAARDREPPVLISACRRPCLFSREARLRLSDPRPPSRRLIIR